MMTTKELSNALGNIGENYIHEAVTYTPVRKKNTWVKWVSMVACLSLMVMGGVFGSVFRSPDTPDSGNDITSYFTITAHAANGESTKLSVADSCFNSGTSKGNIFGVDMPIFNFSVKPSGLKSNEAIYERFDISISYNGTPVKDKDEHIMVAYLISTRNPDEPWAYSISGWFTEPTDVTVNVLDKESREIVETITVNVRYLPDQQGYELKTTNLTTKLLLQKQAAEANQLLMAHLFEQGYVMDYPDWFGGCYIDGDKLYVKLVSPTEAEKTALTRLLAPYHTAVVYLEAAAPLSQLQAYADQTAHDLLDLGYEVTSWYVDSVTGHIVITVTEKDHPAVTDWVSRLPHSENAPTVTVEVSGYISPD